MVDFDYLNKISHSTSIVDVLDYYGIDVPHIMGDRCKVLCPFHNDNTPSLVAYIRDNHQDESFYCYACNMGGDPFLFIREMEGGDFNTAWSILCNINDIDDPEAGSIDNLTDLLRPSRQAEERRSINTINLQISTMYRELNKQLGSAEATADIDKRFKELDLYLATNPSYADLHQYFKAELTRFKKLKSFHNNR